VKTLPAIRPTPEQLLLISENRLGIEIIRGAAGSGKTSTAILRLRSLCYLFEQRKERSGLDEPVRILVLTFNRTLRGYIRALVEEQINGTLRATLDIDAFGHWAMEHLGRPRVVDERDREAIIARFARGMPLSPQYVAAEVDYLLGRFEPDQLHRYLTEERTGRGTLPRVTSETKQHILNCVVKPYKEWLAARSLLDWNDVAVAMGPATSKLNYDIVIADETQDFSANQLRAVRHHLCKEHAVTFVLDALQRIYARGFTWQEIGYDMKRARYHRLQQNHRNTVQIAAFAAGVTTHPPLRRIGPRRPEIALDTATVDSVHRMRGTRNPARPLQG
jgi:superfamily I DNA/RNA helicase